MNSLLKTLLTLCFTATTFISQAEVGLTENGLYSRQKLETDKKATIAFIGGSATANGDWDEKVETAIKERYPDAQIEVVRWAVPYLGSIGQAFGLYQNILSKSTPDLLFIEATTDDKNYRGVEDEQKRAFEGMIRQSKELNGQMDIVVLFTEDDSDAKDNLSTIISTYKAASMDISSSDMATSVIEGVDKMFAATPSTENYKLPKPLDKGCYSTARLVSVKDGRSEPLFSYIENYELSDDAQAIEGFNNVPMLVSEKAETHFSYKFKGNAIGLLLASGPDAGIAEYWVDRDGPHMINLFSPDSENVHVPWCVMLSSGIGGSTHYAFVKLMMEKSSKSKGNACRVVYFLVNE